MTVSSVQLTIYVLVAFGLWYVVGNSLISRSIREWAFAFDFLTRRPVVCDCTAFGSKIQHEPNCSESNTIYVLRPIVFLLECPGCFGFWEGIVAFILGFNVVQTNFWLTDLSINSLFTVGANICLSKALGFVKEE